MTNLLLGSRSTVARTTYSPTSTLSPTHWAKIFEVGPSKTYTTVHAATAAADDYMANLPGWTNGVRPNPINQRLLILVSPGTYSNDYFTPQYECIDIASEGGDPAETTISRAGLVAVTTGKTTWLNGLTFLCTSDDDTNHPWRDAGPSGDYADGSQRRTVVVENCVMRSSDTAGNGGCAIDGTPGGGVVLVASNTQFISPGQVQAVNVVGSLGSVAAQYRVPGWFEFFGCHVKANYFLSNENSSGTIATHSNPVGFPEGELNGGDSFVWQGGSIDDGGNVPQSHSIAVAPLYHTTAGWYIDPAVSNVGIDGYSPGTPEYTDTHSGYMLHRTTTVSWPVVTNGMSPDAHSHYGG